MNHPVHGSDAGSRRPPARPAACSTGRERATRPRGSGWSRSTPRSCSAGAAAGGLRDDDAADVFQEVFQAVAAHLAAFRRDRSGDTFRGWLRTITRNKVNDLYPPDEREPLGVGGSEARERLAQVPQEIPAEEEAVSRMRPTSELLHRALAVDPRRVRAADVAGVLADGC